MNLDLATILVSPHLTVNKLLTEMEDRLDGKTIVNEYTTPFHNLTEMAVSLAKDSLMGSSNIIRKKFPVLASDMETLFFSIHDEVKDNIFAIGGTVPMAFYINVIDLKQYGVQENNGYVTNIPAGSTITALSTTFTLLNDITITLKNNGIVTIEQKESELDIAINDIRLLSSTIITDDNGLEWIVFETKVRNIIQNIVETPITHSGKVEIDIPLTHKYSTIEVGFINNGEYKKIKVSYSDEYLDENNATALIVLKDTSVNVTIPKNYLIDGLVAGKVITTVYETEGEKSLDLSRLTTEDFTLNIENEGKDIYSSTSVNIIMANVSRGTLNNGVDAMTFEELKTAIINSTLGDIDLPITTNHLARKLNMYGYDLRVMSDTLLGREFIASKSLPTFESKLMQAFSDVFFNKAGIQISEDSVSRFIDKYENSFILKEGAVFKIDTTGLIKLLSDEEYSYFQTLNKGNKLLYLKTNKMFFTPLTYVVSYDSDIVSSEVYYLRPTIKTIRILSTNSNVTEKVNTSKFDINRTPTGYTIRLVPVLNNDLQTGNLNKLKARIHLSVRNSNSTVYFDSDYNVSTGMFTFNIETGILSDGVFNVTNGESILKDIKVNLENEAYIYIYSIDESIQDSSNFLISELGKQISKSIVFTKETINIEFGTKLDYIYNNVLTIFTANKYKRYTTSKLAFYKEDVYRNYENGLIINPVVLGNGQVDLGMEVLHKKGDPILDANGVQLYEYKVNDLMLDSAGNPIFDKLGGIKRVMDILMLEYEFAVADSEPYQNYLNIVMNNLMSMIDVDMKELNNITMDVTKIKYKTFRSIRDVPVIVNNIIYQIPYSVSPTITLILDKNNVISNSELLDDIKSICGKVITKHLNSEKVTLENIKNEIKSSLTIAVTAIKISGLDPKNSEVIVTSNDNRFTINKRLELTETNSSIVKYDITLELEYV